MAEIATKKSIKVVSSKKCNDACGVKSNNGLIDLGNITSSNNHTQLITLHDDDVTQNMKIETDAVREDNSLQELIDRELALRISSTNDIYENEMETVDEEVQASRSQPEITKIILEPYMNPQDDINSAFIIAEMNHYTILRDPYTYRNGHSNEDSQSKEDVTSRESSSNSTGSVDSHQIKPKVDETYENDAFIILEAEAPEPSSVETSDTHHENYSTKDHSEKNNSQSSAIVTERPKLLSGKEFFAGEIAQIGQFSDNFDETNLQQQVSMPSNLESVDGDGPLSDSTTLRIEEQAEAAEHCGIEVDLSSTLGSNGIPHRDEDTVSKLHQPSSELVAETSSFEVDSGVSLENRLTSPLVQLSYDAGQLNDKTIGDDGYRLESNDLKFENDDEYVQIERDSIRGMIEHVIGEVVQQAEDQVSQKLAEQEEISKHFDETDETILDKHEIKDQKTQDDHDNGIEIIRTMEKTEQMSTNEQPSRHVFAESRYVDHCFPERRQSPTQDFESWTTVEQATSQITSEQFTEDTIEQFTGTTTVDPNLPLANLRDDSASVEPQQLAPLATSDDEITDVSNKCDVHIESHEDVVTGSSIVTSSTTSTKTTKTTKTKKKKIEGVTSGDASPGLTPKTKKTKKSKKSDSEKENISVKSSSNKFDALSKKPVLHVRSVDASKVQQQFNSTGGQNGDANPNCRSCGKVVFQMEQVKAEGLIWHKNCFRCNQCSKQLNVDNYQSHESTLYCKPHFRELFQPKPVEESDQPIRPRKPELIIRENQPTELPPDVVRASDKPDLGLEELASLNVKSRFQVFEKTNTEVNDIDRSPSQVAVKRSPSILSKLAKFQAKGMDIGVADESLNGIPFEESSESEEEEEEDEEVDTEIVKSKRSIRERPMSFSKMDDMKNRWETTSQQGRRESQREARKEEIAGIRSRLFMGKQGKMKELYQQAVADSERITKINAADEIQEIQQSAHAKSIKERFERGEPISAHDDESSEEKSKHHECPDEEVIAAGISKKSRSIFLELDATAAKTGRPVTPVAPKAPNDIPRRARDAFMGRQVSDDVVRSSDTTEEVRVQTTDISNKFKFFETYKAPETQRRQFRITPPRDGQVKMESPDREIYRDPEVVRADDRVDEVMRTDTARKMLSIFRQMEENATKEDIPDGPKPLKRFTPPPEDKFAKPTASESEDDEEEDGEDSAAEDCAEEHDPNYVRASDKVEDEFLKQSLNAARAKTLRAKFEHWTDETDGKNVHSNVAEMEIAQGAGEQSSIESASSLRARFESLGSQNTETPRTVKVKVNRFVAIPTTNLEVCEICAKKVYPLEKVETNNKIFHKQCFRCLQCNCILRMDTFTLNNGRLYCIPHFKQLFITRGNYDEGFGINPHKNKWASPTPGSPTMPLATNSPTPITVSNGDV